MKKQLIEDIDYQFLFPKDDASSVHIILLTGEFKDTVFKYGKVKFEPADDMMALKFAYNVIESSCMKPKKLEKNDKFKNYIGDLLVDIMGANAEQEFVDETRTNDFKESDLQ